jgi:serine/threonine protein kinase
MQQQQQQETFTDNSSLSAFGFHFDREDDQVHSEPSLGKQQQLHEPRKSVTFQETQSQKPADGKKRHFLYIQMQLCGQQTLADFLSNPNARGSEVDIPYALKLFHQVANGVKYVHEQDLIHRDLKPNNCFLDDSGIVKVGDFGLSREANADVNGLFRVDQDQQDHDNNTAGVGTRSYASPEQLQGSDYDASTDIFSLGLILFELCYPMYTSMERLTEFTRLRKQEFPESWLNGVAKAFPDVHAMLVAMLSTTPSERPSAAEIVDRVERVLGEFTVMTIAQTEHSSLLLRVEADPSDGVLARTMKLIRDSAPGVKIEQYGLRGGESTSVIEFALSNTDEVGLNNVLEAMKACPEIKRVRQVSHTSRERSTSIHEI